MTSVAGYQIKGVQVPKRCCNATATPESADTSSGGPGVVLAIEVFATPKEDEVRLRLGEITQAYGVLDSDRDLVLARGLRHDA